MSRIIDLLGTLDLKYIRFTFPLGLAFLILVPWTIGLGSKLRSLSATRKWTAITIRVIVLLCMIFALAGAELVKINDKLAVFFLLDRSYSIPEATRLAAEQTVKTMTQANMTSKDEAGIVAFGENPSIELSMGPTLELDTVQSYVGGEQTDIAAAIRLAMAAFPQGCMRRIVIMSDGNETYGSLLEEAKLAQAAGVGVDVLPIVLGQQPEVRMREVASPNRVNADEPFKLRVVVEADQDSQATLRLYQRGREGRQLMQTAPVTLQKGDNAFLLPLELSNSGFYEYEAVVESESDTTYANNEGRSFTVVYGEPNVLYVDADWEHSQRLLPALQSEGVRVTQAKLGDLPTSLAQFQNYDSVVLADVSATDLSTDQLNALEAMVRDLGIGLVMIGGPNSFGAGGYHQTPVERALPVNMDLTQRKVLPQGALVCVLHTCEFQDGNAWARAIALSALDVLSSQDLMGALAYDWERGEAWLFNLQPVGDKSAMRSALNTTTIGDMPSVDPTLEMAYEALANCSASVKRVIVISDGDPAAPQASLLNKIKDAKISVSTICINPHRQSDQDMLRWVAYQTGGNYYYVTDPRKLPQIFTKEAAVVKRGLVVEKPFVPKVTYDSEIVRGIDPNSFPSLLGYVATTPKDSAIVSMISQDSDPVLAQWRYGLGKSVAFTSDVTTRWAPDWLKWEGFNQFWSQATRWSLRETSPASFSVDTRVKDGKGHIRIDAVDDQGRFVNFLRPEGVVTGPSPQFTRGALELIQTAPGIYEGTFPLEGSGTYMVNLTYEREDGSRGMMVTGLSMNYSKEYEYNTTNIAMLEQAASVGGGRILEPTSNPFEHNLTTTPAITPIWPYLLAVAACMFPFDVFVRRVVIDFTIVFRWLLAFLRILPGVKRLLPKPKPKRAPLTGVYGAGTKAATTLSYSRVGGDLPRSLQDMPAPPPGQPSALEDMPAEDTEKQAPRSEYTQQLLAAKERALDKRMRRGKQDSDR
ncbi:MAG: glutamine amidotransferase [Candidatus Hydrogenedentes bacterium]|nr:glutamine amidotransferase [Candidatus Hydrogenedentota bacterium]